LGLGRCRYISTMARIQMGGGQDIDELFEASRVKATIIKRRWNYNFLTIKWKGKIQYKNVSIKVQD
jgi:hypothetical protein